jgi:hypothetical protein
MLAREANCVGKPTMLSILLGGDVVVTPPAMLDSKMSWKEGI